MNPVSPRISFACLPLFLLSTLHLAASVKAQEAPDPDPVDLSVILDDAGAIWHVRPAAFVEHYRDLGFDWAREGSRDAARAVGPAFEFAGLTVWDHSVRFRNGKTRDVNVSLYNRGDAGGEMRKSDFEELAQSIRDRLDDWTGSAHVPILDKSRKQSSTRQRWAWAHGSHRLDLVTSYTEASGAVDFRPEFIRLRAVPYDANSDPRKRPVALKKQHKIISVFELRNRVQRSQSGDVVIPDIPMVDQGEKGYCAVATMDRLMQYYGRDVDQHELAQEADTSSSRGTDPESVIRVLRSIAKRVGLKTRVHAEFKYSDYERLLKDYNKVAKKQKKRKLRPSYYVLLSDVYAEMDADLLTEARVRRKSDFSKFKQTVQKYVDGGIPLAWSVMVGKFPEEPKLPGNRINGHLRMIIGYNHRTGELLYSDTWGPGHERKRLPFDQAWAMTTGYFTVAPENIRL